MKKRLVILMGVLVLIAIVTTAFTWSRATFEDVYWNWDLANGENSVGKSRLVRNDNGIHTGYFTSELTGGQAMTLWYIVFNYPEKCTPPGCDFDDLGAARDAQGDFLLADGQVIAEHGYAYFSGKLKVGDISGSGLAELPDGCVPGFPDCGGSIGLVNPAGALVNLAVHSHGPALTGAALESQLNSFTGGCAEFLGAGGFAGSSLELPVTEGQCSTIQQSVHLPN